MAAAAVCSDNKPGKAPAGAIGTKDGLGFGLGDCVARPVAAPAMHLGWLLIAKVKTHQLGHATSYTIIFNQTIVQ